MNISSPRLSPYLTLSESLVSPQVRSSFSNTALNAAMIVGASLVTAASAQIEIPLGFTPVPLTLQTLAVLMLGAVLGARKAAAAMALYLIEGSVGLPFFSGGAMGLAHLLGPTGGYLIGFIPAAALAGMIAERGMDRKLSTLLPAFLAAHTVIFLVGVSWLAQFVGFERALVLGYVPFIGGELLKTLVASLAIRGSWKLLN